MRPHFCPSSPPQGDRNQSGSQAGLLGLEEGAKGSPGPWRHKGPGCLGDWYTGRGDGPACIGCSCDLRGKGSLQSVCLVGSWVTCEVVSSPVASELGAGPGCGRPSAQLLEQFWM